MPEDKIFVDTNVIVYAYDTSAGEKHGIAKQIVLDLWDSGQGLLSTQVLQEFFVTVTAKINKPLDVFSAREIVQDLTKWEVVSLERSIILSATDLHVQYKYSFWDSMIIQAAVSGGAKLLLSEDLSANQTIAGVKIQNPFQEILQKR